ncbi:hypothetical protein HMPREF9134_00559 [Porphyromonas catoniae F0037]|jgi:hypothetical protein|uniref:Uncharacterized protein n=1 Tax=Porphyromonas catoniae F0037 TaxID=1127696 RepID=L1NFV6_9PORP|nr:hypothetical protein [Porphyromonas catoniae]EKY02170.1 hypothetical protein HMPREF9134_00559 [Porphyromonas catoniae F0037]
MKTKHVLIAAIAVIIALVIGFFFILRSQRSELEEEKAVLVNQQRDIMEEELTKLAAEYDIQYKKLSAGQGEQKFSLATDSLISQILAERAKVEQLQKELKASKATSAKRIDQLSREVTTLRNVLRTYVVQIDSLQATNERLRAENTEVKENYNRVTSQAQQLSSEKAHLSDRVKLAAKLDATAISVTPIDKRGKHTKTLSKVVNLQIRFTISKNVTAEVGEKTFYCRITQPNDELLVKAGAGTFAFEGKQIPYSIRREIEYNGEETPLVMYWPVEESLQSGTYQLRIFADGNLIGSASFSL